MINVTKHKNLILYIILIAFISFSCSSPEAKGKKLAQRMNECAESFLKQRQEVETDFVSHFNATDYSTRTEALVAYDKSVIKVLDDYNARYDDVAIERSEIAGEYVKDYKKMAAFQAAYDNNIDPELSDMLLDAIAETDYPAAVLAKVKTVIPVKPDEAHIQKDLVGHQLTEGFEKEKCWFHEDFRWKFGDYKIHDFKIEEVLRNEAKEYTFIATMRLVSELNAFDAQAKVSYWLPDAEDWKIEFVKSMGVTIVKTHKYDDLISCAIEDDGWGGVDALFITNNAEIELGVGVEIVANGARKRYAVRVSPGKKNQVGGLFAGGNVTSYYIDFVERF